MDIGREFQKIKTDLEQKHSVLTGQLRSEIAKANSETRTILNGLDERIEQVVRQHVEEAFSDVKNLLRVRQGAIQ